jgi:hypothetical protein
MPRYSTAPDVAAVPASGTALPPRAWAVRDSGHLWLPGCAAGRTGEGESRDDQR